MTSLLVELLLLTALFAASALGEGTKERWWWDKPQTTTPGRQGKTMTTASGWPEKTKTPWWWGTTETTTPDWREETTTPRWWGEKTTTPRWWGEKTTTTPGGEERKTTTPWWWGTTTTKPRWWGEKTTTTPGGEERKTTTPWWWGTTETTTPDWREKTTTPRWWGTTMKTPRTTSAWWPEKETTPRWWGTTMITGDEKPTTPTTWGTTTTMITGDEKPTTPTTWGTTTTPKRRTTPSEVTRTTTTPKTTPTTAAADYMMERECACNASKLYLDIVVVIDNSLSMNKEGLIEVAADLATLFQPMTVSSGTYTGQFVRVGLVTFANQAVVLGDLNAYGSYEALLQALFSIPYHHENKLNIEAGLQAASSLLQRSRDYARNVVLLYSSAYSVGGFTDPKAIANQMKESGTTIVTVAFRQQPEGDLVKRLGRLASSGFSFGSMSWSIVHEVTNALCQANCFCKDNWMQYSNDFSNPHYKHGECVRFMDIDASWTAARYACRAMADGAHLVNEFTSNKRQFISEYAQSSLTIGSSRSYHIGLRYDRSTSEYYWEGPNDTRIPYFSAVGDRIPPPTAENGDCFMANRWWAGNIESESCYTEPHQYVCQMAACDTDNFCASPDE